MNIIQTLVHKSLPILIAYRPAFNARTSAFCEVLERFCCSAIGADLSLVVRSRDSAWVRTWLIVIRNPGELAPWAYVWYFHCRTSSFVVDKFIISSLVFISLTIQSRRVATNRTTQSLENEAKSSPYDSHFQTTRRMVRSFLQSCESATTQLGAQFLSCMFREVSLLLFFLDIFNDLESELFRVRESVRRRVVNPIHCNSLLSLLQQCPPAAADWRYAYWVSIFTDH